MIRTLFLLFVLSATPLFAARLSVGNNGADSNSCGSKNSPCRSISQAIENASAGDTIAVGPGRYGDLSQDDTLVDGVEGEEFGSNEFNAVIVIDKPLKIVSTDGARATVIDGGDSYDYLIRIIANSVVLGAPNRGFTLFGVDGSVVVVEGSQIRIAGNRIFQDNGTEIGIGGGCLNGSPSTVSDSRVNDNFITGMSEAGLKLCDTTVNWKILRNDISKNSGYGMELDGSNHQVKGNFASANVSVGIRVTGDSLELKKNIVHGNNSTGISSVAETTFSARGNSAVGNYGFGLFSNDIQAATNSNFYGNNPTAIGNFIQCGLFPETSFDFNYNGNYWGNPNGPSFDEGANDICSNTRSWPDPSRSRSTPAKIRPKKPRT